MSSCLAITSRSNDTPPPVGEVSCAVAAPAARSRAAAGRIEGTPRVPSRTGFVIEFLASKARHSDAAALGQVDKVDLKREEGRGSGREDRARRERRPPRALSGASPRERSGAPRRSRRERRCDGRARSRSGNPRGPARELQGQLQERQPRRRARPAQRSQERGCAKRTAPPGGGLQKRRASRPRVAEPALSGSLPRT